MTQPVVLTDYDIAFAMHDLGAGEEVPMAMLLFEACDIARHCGTFVPLRAHMQDGTITVQGELCALMFCAVPDEVAQGLLAYTSIWVCQVEQRTIGPNAIVPLTAG